MTTVALSKSEQQSALLVCDIITPYQMGRSIQFRHSMIAETFILSFLISTQNAVIKLGNKYFMTVCKYVLFQWGSVKSTHFGGKKVRINASACCMRLYSFCVLSHRPLRNGTAIRDVTKACVLLRISDHSDMTSKQDEPSAAGLELCTWF